MARWTAYSSSMASIRFSMRMPWKPWRSGSSAPVSARACPLIWKRSSASHFTLPSPFTEAPVYASWMRNKKRLECEDGKQSVHVQRGIVQMRRDAQRVLAHGDENPRLAKPLEDRQSFFRMPRPDAREWSALVGIRRARQHAGVARQPLDHGGDKAAVVLPHRLDSHAQQKFQ